MSEADTIDFGKAGLMPVVVQDANTLQVLVVAYTNELAFKRTLDTKVVTFWSRSRNELWVKGETSGNRYWLNEAMINCEGNSLLYLATPEAGGMCHITDDTGKARVSCFYRKIEGSPSSLEFRVKE